MIPFRRHLRRWAAAWLTFQALSLSAFVPRDCCIGHRPAAHQEKAEPSCHHAAPAPGKTDADCSMSSNCNGPLGIIASLLSSHAIVNPPLLAIQLRATPEQTPHRGEHPRSLAVPPDSPPPRA